MKRLSRSLLLILLVMFCTITGKAQTAGDANLQDQLSRLQSAVTQARQSGPIAQPAFNVSPQGNAPPPGFITPPATQSAPPITSAAPPAGLQIQTNTATTTTTQPTINLPPGVPPPPGVAPAPVAPTAAPPATTAPIVTEGSDPRDQAFTDTTDSLLPLTPDQIRTLHALFSHTQRAVGEAPGIPPRPTSTSKIVNLSPGATPPIIRLSAGFVSSLVFLDASGAPWPIEAYDLGDPRSYNIQWDRKSNMLMVQAISEYKSGNLAVMLRGLNTPVMLTLLPGQRAVDYRVDLRIPGLGPNATPSLSSVGTSSGSLEILPGASNPLLLDVLNGIPPPGSRSLNIAGRDCQVWLLGKKMFVRTRLTILSPAWISTLSSADGMHAYEMLQTPVLLASENGKMVKLTIQGL